jgi:hypothetical protein
MFEGPACVKKKNKKKKNTKEDDKNGKVFVCISKVSRIYHLLVGPGDNSAAKTVEEPVDLTGPVDGDDGDIASLAQVQSSSANFEVQRPSFPFAGCTDMELRLTANAIRYEKDDGGDAKGNGR